MLRELLVEDLKILIEDRLVAGGIGAVGASFLLAGSVCGVDMFTSPTVAVLATMVDGFICSSLVWAGRTEVADVGGV